MFFFNISRCKAYLNINLLHLLQPQKMRKNINEQLNLNYNYISYQKAKNIMHNDINNIDIYGDNTCDKNVEHVFPQYLFKNDIKRNMMKSDLHNLYLCNSRINTLRQNYKYISHDDYIKNGNDKFLYKKIDVCNY